MRQVIIILAILLVSATTHAGVFFDTFSGPSTAPGAGNVYFDNTEASIPNDPDTVQEMGEELKTLIDNVGTTGVNVPAMAETEDTTGINNRQMILENSGTVNRITWANIISAIKASLAGFFQPDDADLDSLSSGITGPVLGLGNGSGYQALQLASELALDGNTLGLNPTLDLSGYTIDFGLDASDIPDLSATYQAADTELAAIAALANGSGVLTNDGAGNMSWAAGGGSMVYPGAGVPVSTGSAWGTSLTVGTGASNLVQLDESGKLPAVDGSSLTGLFDPAAPGEIGGTTPAAGTFTTIGAGASGFSVDADGDVTAKSLSITRVVGQASYSEYYEVLANGDNKVTVKPADDLAADYTVTWPSATGTLQLAGAEVDLPSSDADPDTTGEIRHDSTITGLLRGALKWFDGTGARILVDLDTAPSDDDYVVSYDADADKFYMKADATGSGSLGSNLSSSTNDITTDNNVIQLIGNSEDIDIEFGTNAVDITTDTGVSSLLVDIPFLAQVYTTTIKQSDHPAGRTLLARECMGGLVYTSGGVDITLPDVTAGMSVAIQCISADAAIIDPDGTEYIRLNGTRLTAGNAIDSSGTAGDMIVITYEDSTTWASWGRSGTWADGGAD